MEPTALHLHAAARPRSRPAPLCGAAGVARPRRRRRCRFADVQGGALRRRPARGEGVSGRAEGPIDPGARGARPRGAGGASRCPTPISAPRSPISAGAATMVAATWRRRYAALASPSPIPSSPCPARRRRRCRRAPSTGSASRRRCAAVCAGRSRSPAISATARRGSRSAACACRWPAERRRSRRATSRGRVRRLTWVERSMSPAAVEAQALAEQVDAEGASLDRRGAADDHALRPVVGAERDDIAGRLTPTRPKSNLREGSAVLPAPANGRRPRGRAREGGEAMMKAPRRFFEPWPSARRGRSASRRRASSG